MPDRVCHHLFAHTTTLIQPLFFQYSYPAGSSAFSSGRVPPAYVPATAIPKCFPFEQKWKTLDDFRQKMKQQIFRIGTFFLVILPAVSCQELESLNATFMMNHKTAVTIKAFRESGIPFDLNTPPVVSKSETVFQNAGSNPVQEIYVDHVKIGVQSPSHRDLSFLKSLHVFIRKEGLPARLLAFRDDIDGRSRTLTLKTSGEDFKGYIEGEHYTLQFQTVTDKVISEDIILVVESRFIIVAELWK